MAFPPPRTEQEDSWLFPVDRDLARSFQAATTAQRERAVVAACRAAVAFSRLDDDAVQTALVVVAGAPGDAANLERRLSALSEAHDAKYFELSDHTERVGPDSLVHFRQARAASALAFALSAGPDRQRGAVYEAIFAAEDGALVARVVSEALRTG